MAVEEGAREIAESVISGRKSAADMARLYNVSQPTVSRSVAQYRLSLLPPATQQLSAGSPPSSAPIEFASRSGPH